MTANDTSKLGPETEADDGAGDVPVVAGDALPPGTVLSDTYEIVEQIALGGMAQVYRARNIHTDEPVAIKVVLPEFARDQTIVALFKKEATVLSRLHHDAIVNYHLFTVERRMKRPYLVMEFVDGVHLGDFYRNNPLTADACRTLMIRIASGLAAAHDAGVIHRDLSPDNVILPESDVAKTKIIDFGIAKAATVGEGTLLGGKFAGKYNFVSPEQLGLGGGEITERSDIYSLGLIAAAAMLGRALDMSGSHVAVLDKRRVIPDLTGVDPSVRPAIEKMLEPLPDDRPHDMRAVIDLWANTTIFSDDGKTVISVDPWTTTPPQRSMPPQRSQPPLQRSQPPEPSSAPRSVPPAPSQPPQQQSTPPVGAWDMAPMPTSAPPDNGSTVVADRSGMPHPEAPREPSMPPPSMSEMRSIPPLPGSAPPAARSVPPQPMPGGATVVGGAVEAGGAPAGSESPFGPYVDKGPKFQLPPEKVKPAKGKGSPVGLFAGIAAVVVIAGGLGLAFTQGWIGGSAPVVPAPGGSSSSSSEVSQPQPQPEQPAAQPEQPAAQPEAPSEQPTPQGTAAPVTEEQATSTPSGTTEAPALPRPRPVQPETQLEAPPAQPAEQQGGTSLQASTENEGSQAQGTSASEATSEAPAGTTAEAPQSTTVEASQSTTVEAPATTVPANPSTPAATQTDEQQVASLPNAPTPVPGLTKAAAQLAWLDAYPVGKCEYVHATQVADNSFGIEAYGDSASPFSALATEFKKANGVDPQVGVRLLDQSQCPVADFLQEVKSLPLAAPPAGEGGGVPTLTLSNTNLENGDTLAGWIVGTPGWHTDLLLVDYGGGVQNITPVLQDAGKMMRFTLPGLATDSTAAAPLVLIAVAGKSGPVDAAQISETFAAGAILPRILREIEANPADFAVSPGYFQIKPAKAASN